MNKVSIIIPVYNTEEYLSKAINSCINQTFKDIEIIIVNDGSTDNSLLIAQRYEEENDCIFVITTENKGLSEARNTGLKVARGRYIYFLDSDDWIEPETIEMCYDLATEKDLDMVLFDSKVEVDDSLDSLIKVDYDYCKRDKVVKPNTVYNGREFIELYSDKKGVFVQACLIFTKRDFLTKYNISFLPNAYYEDVAFHFACMMRAERIMYIPQAYHNRLYRSGSIMTSSLNVRKICSVYEISIEMLSSIIRFGKYKDDIWLQYLLQRIKGVLRTVLYNITRRDLSVAKTHYFEIIKLQEECINLFFRTLCLSGEKVSNIKKSLEFAEEITTPFGWISNKMITSVSDIMQERNRIIHDLFSNLPLDKEGTQVALYGSGKHAAYLLNNYKNVIGDIKANLIFIDTYKESFSDKFYDCDIVNVKDLHTVNISEIIILSYLYEDEMYNNIVSQYGNEYKIHKIYNGDKEPLDSTKYLDIYNRLIKFNSKGRKRIILLYTPQHTNIGDHMIAEASLKFFHDFLPNYDVMEVTSNMYINRKKEVIYQTNVEDIIVINGGGFLGSLWPSGQNVYDILKDFPDNKIVILPQSIYFEDNEEGERHKKLAYEEFNGHTDLSVCYREEYSLHRSENLLGKGFKSFIMPDMVLTLNYSYNQEKREGVLLCLREDREGILSDYQKKTIKEHFLNQGEKVNETSMHWPTGIIKDKREEVIDVKINEFKSHKLVITDTLHCMISCTISGTPCIALNNISSKVEGVYNTWLKDVKYIRYVNSYEDIMNIDLENWEELYKNNYYDKTYINELKSLANIIQN